MDSVTLIEVWDFLRDVMIMILGKRQPDHLQALAALTRNTICSALGLILAYLPCDHGVWHCYEALRVHRALAASS
jgi:hypothetical protein